MEEIINSIVSPSPDAKTQVVAKPNKSHRSLGFRVRLVEEYKDYDTSATIGEYVHQHFTTG